MTDSTQHTPDKTPTQAGGSPGSSSVAPTEVSSAPTSPAQPRKGSDMANKKDKTAVEAAVKAAEVAEGWSDAHKWYFGQVVGLFERYGTRGEWNKFVAELSRIHESVVMIEHSSVAREGMMVPLILASAGVLGTDPSVLCVRTSGTVLRLGSVAMALKVANAFNDKNFNTFHSNVSQLNHTLQAQCHTIQGIQTEWTRYNLYLVRKLVDAFVKKQLDQIEAAYTTISQVELLARIGIVDLTAQKSKLDEAEASISRRGWQIDQASGLIRIVKRPVVDSEIGRFEFSYVVRQIQNIELQV